ncbi:MAG: MoaD/ThiS family protein [Oscillospiraceae bacterium]|nr:MoaD/ThiS family protein [Oscillospiraceae bacterium]
MEVRLFATLREKREKVVDVPWTPGLDGYALLGTLGIAPEDVAIFLINGVHHRLDAPLNAEDVVALFPPVGGG